MCNRYFLTLTCFDPLLLVPRLSAFSVIFLATIERIAHPTLAPIATYPRRDIPPPLVFDSNVISVITGDIMIDSVPTKSVVFAIPLDTSLMTVQLNIFLPLSLLQFFFLIAPSYFSSILIVYLLGEVDAFTPTLRIFSFAPYPPFVSLTFPWT